MINYAIRYKPILAELRRLDPEWVLDVGSGPEGLAMFWRGCVVGTDLAFKRRPVHHAVRADALSLPLQDHSCPVVVSCDMLEHIAPAMRHAAVQEMSRVASDTLLLSFPSGDAAERVYRDLAQSLKGQAPRWLEEHLLYGLPDSVRVVEWLREEGWNISTLWYESARAHRWLIDLELRVPVKVLTYGLMRLTGPWLAPLLPVATGGLLLRLYIRATR